VKHRRRRVRSSLAAIVVATTVASLVIAGPAGAAPEPTFTFTGGGWGHGVGMSQYGAKERAQQGASAEDILAAYFPGAEVTKRSQSGVRVLVATADTTTLQFAASGRISYGRAGTTIAAGGTARLRVVGNKMELQVTAPTKRAPITISAKTKISVALNGDGVRVSASGYRYRDGRLAIRLDDGELAVVNEDLTMQQYLYGLGEMPSSWPSAALEAQAIAARTYAYRRVANPRSATYDLTATTFDQAYIGADATNDASGPNWIAAVDATNRQILTDHGVPIEALYSSSNGGYMTSAGYVFGTDLAYLDDGVDPYDQVAGNSYFRWTRTYTGAELGAYLKAARDVDVGTVTSVQFSGDISASGRTDRARVELTGKKGSVTINGAQLRAMVNRYAPAGRGLPSTLLFFASAGAIDATAVAAGHIRVTGWVGLRGSNQTALARITVNGQPLATLPTDHARPDVARVIDTGPTTGFTVDVPVAGHKNKVCLYGVMVSGAEATLVACRDVKA
jgi:SpoIID/LytB domain protein